MRWLVIIPVLDICVHAGFRFSRFIGNWPWATRQLNPAVSESTTDEFPFLNVPYDVQRSLHRQACRRLSSHENIGNESTIAQILACSVAGLHPIEVSRERAI